MAVVNEYTLQGNDLVSPSLKSASANTKQLGREMKGFSAVMNQTGIVAALFGNTQLASVVNQFESAVIGTRQMTNELGKSKLAFAAVATAATAGGFAVGNYVRQFVPFFNEVDKLEKAQGIMARIGEVSAQRLSLRDSASGAFATQRAATDAEIGKLKNRFGAFGNRVEPTREENDLIFQLEQLQAERAIKLEAEKEQTIGDMIRKSKADILALEIEHLGTMAAEDIRYAEIKRALETNTVIDADGRNTLLEDAYRIHQLKMSAIHQAGQDRIVEQEKINKARRLAIQDQLLTSGSEMFGNLAIAAKAFGKKGLAVWKAFATAQAIIDTYKAANAAYAALAGIPIVGPALGIAAAAAAIAAGLANVSAIQSTNANQAHGGLDYVPADSTFLLQQGERVVQRDQNERLTNFLDGGGGGGGAKQYMVNIYLDAVAIARGLGQMSRDGRLEISARAIV